MCRKLKTIRVEVRNGSGTTSYTYQTDRWPKESNTTNNVSVEDTLDNFVSQRTLAEIFRGRLNLCSLFKNETNRNIWKLIFDEIEKETDS